MTLSIKSGFSGLLKTFVSTEKIETEIKDMIPALKGRKSSKITCEVGGVSVAPLQIPSFLCLSHCPPHSLKPLLLTPAAGQLPSTWTSRLVCILNVTQTLGAVRCAPSLSRV